MGLVPETVIAMLACTRIGAIPSVIHNGLSANALSGRIKILECELVITQDYILRKGSYIPIKEKVDKAIEENTDVKNVIVFVTRKQILNCIPKEIFSGEILFLRQQLSVKQFP